MGDEIRFDDVVEYGRRGKEGFEGLLEGGEGIGLGGSCGRDKREVGSIEGNSWVS